VRGAWVHHRRFDLHSKNSRCFLPGSGERTALSRDQEPTKDLCHQEPVLSFRRFRLQAPAVSPAGAFFYWPVVEWLQGFTRRRKLLRRLNRCRKFHFQRGCRNRVSAARFRADS
jgi:hypothetical protein